MSDDELLEKFREYDPTAYWWEIDSPYRVLVTRLVPHAVIPHGEVVLMLEDEMLMADTAAKWAEGQT